MPSRGLLTPNFVKRFSHYSLCLCSAFSFKGLDNRHHLIRSRRPKIPYIEECWNKCFGKGMNTSWPMRVSRKWSSHYCFALSRHLYLCLIWTYIYYLLTLKVISLELWKFLVGLYFPPQSFSLLCSILGSGLLLRAYLTRLLFFSDFPKDTQLSRQLVQRKFFGGKLPAILYI